jgi:hypothetical protein
MLYELVALKTQDLNAIKLLLEISAKKYADRVINYKE